MSAVYGIFCIPEGRAYIGRSDNPMNRFMQHKKALSNGDHYNKELQQDWKRSGPAMFNFKIIKWCNQADSKFYELYYINRYKDRGYKLYNFSSVKDKTVWLIVEWLMEHKLYNFEIDFKINDCTDKKPLNWNLKIQNDDKTILINLYNPDVFLPENRLSELENKNMIRADYCDSKGYYLISEDYNDQSDSEGLAQWIELQIIWICKK